jgi:hypothetical protein
MEQADAELHLQLGYLPAQGRLGDVAAAPGGGEAAGVRDGDDVLQLAQFHAP